MNLTPIDQRILSAHANEVLASLTATLPQWELPPVMGWLSTFHDYQLEWILDWNRRALLNKARQIGASHAYAAAGVLWSMLGEPTTIVSVGEREAIEVLDKARSHSKLLVALGSKWAQLGRDTATLLLFKNTGGKMLALPATSGGRSFSGNVLLDEFAYQDNADEVWDGAGGTITRGWKIRVMSTPNGVGNMWHAIFTDPKQHEGYNLHEVTLEQAIEQGLEVDMAECWKNARNDPRVFDQMFRCQFLGGDLQYIPTDAVNDCSTDNLYTFDGYYYAGLDIGRTADKTVLIVVRKDPHSGMRTVAQITAFRRTDSTLLENLVAEAFKRYKLKRLCVDSSGMGSFPVDQMRKRHGRTRVEGVNFTLQSKEELATGLYAAFTEQTVSIPKTDSGIKGLQAGLAAQLRQDVCSLRREITAAGNVRYDAPHTNTGHADSAWALALALQASGGLNRQRHTINLTGGSETLY